MATIKKKAYAGRRQSEQEIVTLANNFSDFVSANQKVLTVVLAAAVVLVLGYGGLHLKRTMEEQKAAPLFAAAYGAYAIQTGGSPDYARALGMFRDVHLKYPSTRSGELAHYYIANTLMDMGTLDEALKEYQAFIKDHSGDQFLLGLVYTRMGYLYRALGKQQDAIQAFERSESLIEAGIATIELARLYESSGNAAESQKKYKTIADKFAGTPWAMEASGKVEKLQPAPPAAAARQDDAKKGK